MSVHPAGPRHADFLPATHAVSVPEDLYKLHKRVWPVSAERRDGAVHIGGVSLSSIAERYGTPYTLLDEVEFRRRAREYVQAFGENTRVYYAGKAFLSRQIARWVRDEGLCVDVCSTGELAVCKAADFPPERIGFHGNNKSHAELEEALRYGVGTIVLDSLTEIERLAEITARTQLHARVLLRVTLGVEAHTHEYIATAHEDQKFGLSLTSGAAADAVKHVMSVPGVHLAGFHSHIGSQIFDTSGFEVSAHRLVEFAALMRATHGVEVEELNLGGGLGIAYTPHDDPAPVQKIAESLRAIVARECAASDLPLPQLSVEPGRAVIGPAGVTVYEVGTVKPVPVDAEITRWYVSVDGGMSDNIRTALYDAEYTCVRVNRESDAPAMLSRVVGKHCEAGDIVVRDAWLPSDLQPGDVLAVAATGAYCRSMASNYNYIPRPPVLSVRDGEVSTVLRRETTEDLLRLEG